MRALALLLVPSLALAHGGLPVSQSVMHDGDTLYVPVVFWGLWVGPDTGPWKWICEEEINPNRTRHYALTTDGAFFATDTVGLTRSIDHGCTWTAVTGELSTLRLSDVAADPTDGKTAWATSDDVTDSPDGGESASNALFVTHDHGDTFARVASLDGTDRRFHSVKLSGTTIYVASGGLHSPFDTAIEKSPDGGMTWEHHLLAFSVDGNAPYSAEIMAIDPRDANVVYLRAFVTVPGDGGSTPLQVLLRSTDGGATVTELHRVVGETTPAGATRGIDGVAVDTTRDQIYVATSTGLMTASSTATSLTPTGGLSQAQCVDVHGGAVYACGTNYAPDFKALARSDDGAQTFKQVLSYQDTVGPIDCPAGTPVGDMCPYYWITYSAQLGINMGVTNDGGGSADMGSGGGGGCSCDLGARSQIPFLLVLLVAGLVPLRRYLLIRR